MASALCCYCYRLNIFSDGSLHHRLHRCSVGIASKKHHFLISISGVAEGCLSEQKIHIMALPANCPIVHNVPTSSLSSDKNEVVAIGTFRVIVSKKESILDVLRSLSLKLLIGLLIIKNRVKALCFRSSCDLSFDQEMLLK